ncbi:unnamed protein product [Enterobius vermicularis]|uniref:RRM domain-containing protein n=1 Tax=Enterobius vermicularis TaxID=51028 RepID=A0A0N4V958_ENTVE|nr:unnamed protein product [Enterobius vermicularis]
MKIPRTEAKLKRITLGVYCGSKIEVGILMAEDEGSGLHKGFGFVIFKDSESVLRAIANGPHVIDGEELSFKSFF